MPCSLNQLGFNKKMNFKKKSSNHEFMHIINTVFDIVYASRLSTEFVGQKKKFKNSSSSKNDDIYGVSCHFYKFTR